MVVPCAGVILCGGRGNRMGGIDKPLLKWRGQALIEPIVQVLQTRVSPLYISANRRLDEYQRYGTVITDRLSGHQGPLAGIQAVLAETSEPLLFVCPGDAPRLPDDLVDRMITELEDQDQAAVVNDGRQQHLHLLIRTTCREPLQDYLNAGYRSVVGWLNTITVRSVDYPHPDCFRSFNQPEDWSLQ